MFTETRQRSHITWVLGSEVSHKALLGYHPAKELHKLDADYLLIPQCSMWVDPRGSHFNQVIAQETCPQYPL